MITGEDHIITVGPVEIKYKRIHVLTFAPTTFSLLLLLYFHNFNVFNAMSCYLFLKDINFMLIIYIYTYIYIQIKG